MEELLKFIVESLVEDKDSVKIEKVEEENAVVYSVSVNPNETGMVIGKNGKVAQAIRSILHSASRKEHKKCIVKIKWLKLQKF